MSRSDRRGVVCGFSFGCLIIIMLTVMMIAYMTGWGNHDRQVHGIVLSGYDNNTWLLIKHFSLRYSLLRHPLLALLLYPLHLVYLALHPLTGDGTEYYIACTAWGVMAIMVMWLTYRLLNRILHVGTADSIILTTLFLSLGHVMVGLLSTDHMAISLLMLLVVLNIRPCTSFLSTLLSTLLLGGVTLTNGIKVLLLSASNILFNPSNPSNPSSLSHPSHSSHPSHPFRQKAVRLMPPLAGTIMAFLLLFGAYYVQNEYVVKPEIQARVKARAAIAKKNAAFAAKQKRRTAALGNRTQKQVAQGPLFEFTDVTINRWRSACDNIFGEGLILHDSHLLDDPNLPGSSRKRPQFVSYTSPLEYAAEALLLMLLLAGAIYIIIGGVKGLQGLAPMMPKESICCASPIPLAVLSWFLLDMVLHLGFNFAATDAYIMTSHWALVIPIALAALLTTPAIVRRRQLMAALRIVICLLTVYLLMHNSSLLAGYLVGNSM